MSCKFVHFDKIGEECKLKKIAEKDIVMYVNADFKTDMTVILFNLLILLSDTYTADKVYCRTLHLLTRLGMCEICYVTFIFVIFVRDCWQTSGRQRATEGHARSATVELRCNIEKSFRRSEGDAVVRLQLGSLVRRRRRIPVIMGTFAVLAALFVSVSIAEVGAVFSQSLDSDFTFTLPAGRKECFFQTMRKDASLEIEYQVIGFSLSFIYNKPNP